MAAFLKMAAIQIRRMKRPVKTVEKETQVSPPHKLLEALSSHFLDCHHQSFHFSILHLWDIQH